MSPLTEADYDRFHRLAPKVLANRTWANRMREVESATSMIVAGLVPILGVAYLGWSATNWIVFLVAGCWMGLLCDYLRLIYLRPQIDSWCDYCIEDTFVSVVGQAIRNGQDEIFIDHRPKRPPYDYAVITDIAFCSVSSLIIFVSLPDSVNAEVFGKPYFLLLLILILTHQLVMAVWGIIVIRNDDPLQSGSGQPIVKLFLGLRGAAIFITMFAVVMSTDGAEDAKASIHYAVYGINGLLVLIGLMTLGGGWLRHNETRWLRKYLATRRESP